MLKAKITATGSYVPEKILTNFDLEKIIDTTDEWILERTGIKERRIVSDNQTVSTLALEASKTALKRRSMPPETLDLIIMATITGDMPVPASACFLQDGLGAKNAAAFDVNAACSGFLYGLSIADAYIKAKKYENILVVGSEVLSKFTDWEDRNTCVLFGDAAGAAIVEASEGENGVLSTDIYSDGSMADLLYLPGGGSKNPPSNETIENRLHYLKMKGNETFKVAVRTLEKLVIDTVRKNNIKASDISLLIPHQANLRIIAATASRLGLDMDKVMLNLDRYGNTSASSIPVALDEAITTEKIKENDYILLEAFGGGLTWASALIRW